MTPKKQAKELVDMFCELLNNHIFSGNYDIAKDCSLLAIDFAKENPLNTDGYNKYLKEVKTEIEKL